MIKLKDILKEAKKRDYKAEYKKFQSSTKSKKYRAELNAYNRKKGTYGNGDGKDASHKGGKIVGFEAESKNRGRAEKSRLKKEGKLNEGRKVSFDKVKRGTEIHYDYGVKYMVSKLYPGGFTMLKRTPGKKGIGSMFAEKTNMEKGNYESQVKLGFIKKVKY